jgi:ribosomal protein S18 acetylase RimI-like enzyme
VNLVLREADPDDADALARLLGQLGYATSAAAVTRRLIRFTASEADRCVVAAADGELVGMATLHASLTIVDDGLAGKLSAIVVDERYRQRGIGAMLVSELEALARAQGCSLLFLTTAESRSGAHGFYRRVGFEETGRRFAKRLA